MSPGPWALVERDECSGYKLVDANGELIEYLNDSRYVDERDDPEQRANLHLMASAWALRDALQTAASVLAEEAPTSKAVATALAVANNALSQCEVKHV